MKKKKLKNRYLKKKVLLVGDIGRGENGYFHIGDEAMWMANVEMYKSLDFKIFATTRDLNDKYYNVNFVKDIMILSIDEFYQHIDKKNIYNKTFTKIISDIDVLHISGGGNLNNLWPGHFFFRFFLIDIARRLDKKIIITSQTVGPLSDEQKEILSNYLDCIDYFGIRDDFGSKKLLIEAGLNINSINVDGDDALKIKTGLNLEIPQIKTNYFVSFHENKLLKNLAKKHKTFKNIPHVMHKDFFEFPDIKKVAFKLPSDKLNPQKYRNKVMKRMFRSLCNMDGGIVSRYHAAVFSLLLGVPVIAIAIDDYYMTKFKGLYKYFDIPYNDYVFHISNISSIRDIDRLLANQKKLLKESNALQKYKSNVKNIVNEILYEKKK